MDPIRVFISYTHDSPEHSARVLGLANRLRETGFDCDIDQYHVNQDWPAWMERSIAQAQFVLVLCTPIYRRRWDNQEEPGRGLGAQWETLLTRQHLHLKPGTNNKFVPVVFAAEHINSIPTPLTNVTRVVVSEDTGFDQLRCRLLNIPPAQKPPRRTSLAPFKLAEGFFKQSGLIAQPSRPSARVDAGIDGLPYGIVDKPEPLISNLFPVSFPSTMQTAKVTVKRTVKFSERLLAIWKQLKNAGEPPMDYWIEGGVLYRFGDFSADIWQAMIQRKLLTPQPPKLTADWAQSPRFSDKNQFIKLLNRCLDELCATSVMAHTMAWSKQMKCHLFVAKPNTLVGKLRVKAIKTEGNRVVYKAIRNKLSEDPKAIQHWQHQAFRHSFVRYGNQWFLNVIPFWAFTSDGSGGPSRWQKTSSANMRRPEKNRAVLGHIMFWASILCREADLVRSRELFQIHRPSQIEVTPSIDDAAWIKISKDTEKQALTSDMGILL